MIKDDFSVLLIVMHIVVAFQVCELCAKQENRPLPQIAYSHTRQKTDERYGKKQNAGRMIKRVCSVFCPFVIFFFINNRNVCSIPASSEYFFL